MSQPAATAIIADDEEPMRDMLRKRLSEAWPELNIRLTVRVCPARARNT